MTKHKNVAWFLVAILTLLLPCSVFASTTLHYNCGEDEVQEAVISADYINRIHAPSAILDGKGERKRTADLRVVFSERKPDEVFIEIEDIAQYANTNKKITYYMITATGTYGIALVPKKGIMSQTINVVDTCHKSGPPPGASTQLSPSYIEGLSELMVSMGNDETDIGGYNIIAGDPAEDLSEYKEYTQTRVRSFIGLDYVGEVYKVTNINPSKKEIIIYPTHFAKKGVRATGVRRVMLPYGVATTVCIIRDKF